MFRRLLASAAARLPSQCLVCHAWPSEPVCEACVQRFAQPVPRCRTCALPTTGGADQCGDCVRYPQPLDACYCAVAYDYPWTDCVSQFKFRQHPGWAVALADLMRHAPWIEATLDDCDLVLPMPLSRQKLRERGFNQSMELARRLSPAKTDAHLLLRIRDTAPQLALGAAARRQNVRGAFAIEPLRSTSVRGRRVVLLDDVMTSGASMFAAAEALREAGVASIKGLVLARTPKF